MSMARIGVLGGSFDPVHDAHIKLAECAYRELSLDKVIFMPAYIQPFKTNCNVTDELHRYNMLRLATEKYPYFEVSDLEISLKGTSYTARTLTELNKDYSEIVFILGADSYLSLSKWYKPEVIFQIATIACAVRDDVDMSELIAREKEYLREYNGHTVFLKMPRTDISSTDIRNCIAKGDNPTGVINEKVYSYIKENGLYE